MPSKSNFIFIKKSSLKPISITKFTNEHTMPIYERLKEFKNYIRRVAKETKNKHGATP